MLLFIFISSNFGYLEFVIFSFYYYLNFDILILKLLCFDVHFTGKDFYDYPLFKHTNNKKQE